MAFWGIEVKPGRPYTHLFESVRGRLHISQATLGIGSATKKSLVQCNVGNKSPVLLCSLLPDKSESCPLNLEFAEADEVVFSVIGPRSVHLTGYFLGNGWHSNLNEDSESYGEDIAETESEESNHYSEEEEYEDSFIDDDDDPKVYPSSPVSNRGVVTEEILDCKKPKKAKAHRRLRKKYLLGESDDEDHSQQQRIAKHSTSTLVLESEDEDILPISSLVNAKNIAKNADMKAEEKGDKEIVETGKNEAKDDVNCVIESNSKADTVTSAGDGDGDGEREGPSDLPFNSLLPSTEVVSPETGTKPKKKRKARSKEGKALEGYSDNHSNVLKEDKTKQGEVEAYNMGQDPFLRNQQDQKPVKDKEADLPHTYSLLSTEVSLENGVKPKKKRKKQDNEGKTLKGDSTNHIRGEAKADDMRLVLSVRNEQDQKPAHDKIFDNDAGHFADEKQSEEKKIKKKKRSKHHENDGNVNANIPLFSMEERNASVMEIEGKNDDTKSSQVRTLSNGLVIEELEMGKLDGKIAALGKKLKIHYIGKLTNGHIFDSSIDGTPYKFRLGSGEVIKGWDVGLEGMHVGDKRRLTIPPSMGYGSHGSGENIPPNSWLVFDVELVGVR